jgi:hypothetical protein
VGGISPKRVAVRNWACDQKASKIHVTGSQWCYSARGWTYSAIAVVRWDAPHLLYRPTPSLTRLFLESGGAPTGVPSLLYEGEIRTGAISENSLIARMEKTLFSPEAY